MIFDIFLLLIFKLLAHFKKKGSLAYMLADTNDTKLKISSFIRLFQFSGTSTF